ncbi:MAG: alanine dehydrogenase [Chloroflexi bacterium]|nr:alanine dehydrogenase [Chloroflexota bacterium]MBI3761974.1 alanine dehydrogenase [Chloroflexota bacterium]
MNIGVPSERRPHEFRVGLTPAGAKLLTSDGHSVYVERGAGLGSGFDDESYEKSGARIVYSGEEAYGRAELVLKVARPTVGELQWLVEGQALLGFLHLPAAHPSKIRVLLDKKITAIAYEQIRLDDDSLPVLKPLSQVGGRMAAQIAAGLLQNNAGGKGVLLGGVAGVPPANVAIIGAGTVGVNAAHAFLGLGAHVFLLDRDFARLQTVHERFEGRVATMVSHSFNVARVCEFADVLVGAVLVPGQRAPIVVTREMVRRMRPRSAILDISIDQGGCVETSRPTTHSAPTFVEEGVIHYCVPNMPGVVGRTATHAYQNAAWPYIQTLAELGVEATIATDPALARGVNTHGGQLRNLVLTDFGERGED